MLRNIPPPRSTGVQWDCWAHSFPICLKRSFFMLLHGKTGSSHKDNPFHMSPNPRTCQLCRESISSRPTSFRVPGTRRFRVKWPVLCAQTRLNRDTACSFPEGLFSPSLSWIGGSGTTLTCDILVWGLVSLTDHAVSRYPRFPPVPQNQEVPG
jgi:hypothetical protein